MTVIQKLNPRRDRLEFAVARHPNGVVVGLSKRVNCIQAFNAHYHDIKPLCDNIAAEYPPNPERMDLYTVKISRTFWGIRRKIAVHPFPKI